MMCIDRHRIGRHTGARVTLNVSKDRPIEDREYIRLNLCHHQGRSYYTDTKAFLDKEGNVVKYETTYEEVL